MDYKINGFTKVETTKKDIDKLKNLDFIFEIEKDLIYLEINSKKKINTGMIYVLFKKKDDYFIKITTITFNPAQTIENIIKNKKELIKYIKLKIIDIEFDLKNTSSNPYGIYKYG